MNFNSKLALIGAVLQSIIGSISFVMCFSLLFTYIWVNTQQSQELTTQIFGDSVIYMWPFAVLLGLFINLVISYKICRKVPKFEYENVTAMFGLMIIFDLISRAIQGNKALFYDNPILPIMQYGLTFLVCVFGAHLAKKKNIKEQKMMESSGFAEVVKTGEKVSKKLRIIRICWKTYFWTILLLSIASAIYLFIPPKINIVVEVFYFLNLLVATYLIYAYIYKKSIPPLIFIKYYFWFNILLDFFYTIQQVFPNTSMGRMLSFLSITNEPIPLGATIFGLILNIPTCYAIYMLSKGEYLGSKVD